MLWRKRLQIFLFENTRKGVFL